MQREIRTQSFKGHNFNVVRGSLHPEYSFSTFAEEEHDFRDQYWNIKQGDVVIDIGASYGSYSLTACAMGATVYSFEPEKMVFCDLSTNVALNGWNNTCFPINAGMWSSSASINMKTYAPHWSELAISGDYNMTTIDETVRMCKIEKIDWIKIDVEGAEEHVINGGRSAITRFKPKLIIECHTFLDAALNNKVKSLLSTMHNYIFEDVVREPCITVCATP